MAMKGLGLDHGHHGLCRTQLLDARSDGLGGRLAAAANFRLTPMSLLLKALHQLRPRELQQLV